MGHTASPRHPKFEPYTGQRQNASCFFLPEQAPSHKTQRVFQPWQCQGFFLCAAARRAARHALPFAGQPAPIFRDGDALAASSAALCAALLVGSPSGSAGFATARPPRIGLGRRGSVAMRGRALAGPREVLREARSISGGALALPLALHALRGSAGAWICNRALCDVIAAHGRSVGRRRRAVTRAAGQGGESRSTCRRSRPPAHVCCDGTAQPG